MIKACVFDLDGTLLDTLTTIAYYGNLALNKFGIRSIEIDEYKYLAGNGAKILIERMLKATDSYSEEMYEKVYEYYNEQYNANTKLYTKPFPGICELLGELKKRNVLTGVISNKPDFAAVNAIKDSFEDGLIDVAHGQIEGVKIKPEPDGAIMVLNELGVKADECLYIGDTWVDMQTGKNLGAYTIGVLWGFRDYDELKSNGADMIVEKPDEILEYIIAQNM